MKRTRFVLLLPVLILALLESHIRPASSWSDTEPQRGEIRHGAEKILKKAGEDSSEFPFAFPRSVIAG